MKVLASVLIVIGCLLATPALAAAATFTVDSVNDEPDAGGINGTCQSAGLKCTLRAAIEESNGSIGTKDTIKFASDPFDGKAADTIAIGSSLPTIVDAVHIDGDSAGLCATEAGQFGPCAGVNGPPAGSALTVQADGVEIDGLAITGAAATGGSAAINVINASEGFVARDNWLGVKLDGTAGANSKGIFLDPNSNGATIGGTATADRNVFANNGFEGLDIEGADDADVLGNYFGVKPDGSTQASNNKDIEITDTVAFEATGNEVGRAIPTGSLAAPCDSGCNVISGATFAGIDLHGNGGNEEPATGPTTIRGNYIGLNAAGAGVVANATYGVLSQASVNTTVGGEDNGEGNYFAGGGTGIYHQDGEGFAALRNLFGGGPGGADLTSPGMGVFVYCLNLGTVGVDPVTVSQNVFSMEGGIAIEERFGNADIEENFIEGAGTGIFTLGDPPGAGNLIAGNVIGESVTNGLLIENDFNVVLDNAIYDSGAAGIRIQNPAPLVITTGNLIGDDSAAGENTIRQSGGDAIEIVDNSGNTDEDSQNAVGRNHGDENAGFFIDLVGNANGGILPPTFATSQQSSASGSGAGAFATIRIFRKSEPGLGEIESTLGETTADGSGNWKVAYPASIPVGTEVAATQTSAEGGTSELVIATTTPDPSGGGGGGSGGNGNGNPGVGGGGKDQAPPQTKIVKGPKGKIEATTVKFKFSSSEAGSTFQCKLDKKPFKKCKSPKKYKGLKPGKHVFKVRAIDAAGNVDSTPAKRKFRVLD